MGKKKKELLGELEELVLLALMKLGSESYGVPVHQALEEATDRFISIGSIYATLDRLERNGFVSSRIGETTAERGGRAKRYFKIEGAGIEALREADKIRLSMVSRRALQPLGGRA